MQARSRRRLQDGTDADVAEHARRARQVDGKGTAKGGNAELQRAWYQGQVAKYFSFDEAPLSAAENVPLSPIYVTFNVNPDPPNGGPGSGFKAEPSSQQTHNVPATLPGDAGYSPLWLVAVYDNADCPRCMSSRR